MKTFAPKIHTASDPLITKADGTKEPFNPEKLKNSLMHSSASEETAEKIIEHLEDEIEGGTTTAELYKHAFFLLHKTEKRAALHYSLRRAVMALGPTGFAFEKYVAEILKERGYSALTGQIVLGGCVPHEVDVIAWNESKLIMAEAKFHNQLGVKTDLKVALYVKARFDDLKEATFFYGKRRPLDEAWLITNTKFTSTAIEYGMCKSLTMIGWNYPGKGNLQNLIEDGSLHPITCLQTLSRSQMAQLISHGVVLCREISSHRALLREIGLESEKIEAILEEVNNL